jgi:hypothetical protein
MFLELEKAAELEPNRETFTLLYKAYMSHDMQAEADIYADRLKKLKKAPTARARRILRPRRVIA